MIAVRLGKTHLEPHSISDLTRQVLPRMLILWPPNHIRVSSVWLPICIEDQLLFNEYPCVDRSASFHSSIGYIYVF